MVRAHLRPRGAALTARAIAVILSDGFSYERRAVQLWLAASVLSPITGAPLASREPVPNVALTRAAKVTIAILPALALCWRRGTVSLRFPVHLSGSQR